MELYDARGRALDLYDTELEELDALLRQVVDAIRYRRTTLGDGDPYGRAVTRLTEVTLDYTVALRCHGDGCYERTPAGVGPILHRRAS